MSGSAVIIFILIIPFGWFIFGTVGKIIDRQLYKRTPEAQDDPNLKGAGYSWRHRFLRLYVAFFISFASSPVLREASEAGYRTDDVLWLTLKDPNLYKVIAIFFLILQGIAWVFARRMAKQGERKLTGAEQEFSSACGFSVADSSLGTARKGEIELAGSHFKTMRLRIKHPLGRSFSFSLHDPQKLSGEIGSDLSEKVRQLQIPLDADKEYFYFTIDPRIYEKAKKNIDELCRILAELKKELSYRRGAVSKEGDSEKRRSVVE